MNTKLVAIAVAVIILVGAGGFLLYNKSKTNTSPSTQPSTSSSGSAKTEMMGGSSTLSDLFSGGKTQKCTFDVKGTTGGSTNGTVYVSGDKAYGNFAITDSSGKASNTYMIRNNDTFYIWGSSLPTGIKMTMSLSDLASKTQGAQYSNMDVNQKLNYNCSAWSVDNTLFTPPTTVKFTDESSIMQASPVSAGGTGSGGSAQCTACNYLSGSQKTNCLALYKCQ